MNSLLRSIVYDMSSKLGLDDDLENVVACITYKYSESALGYYSNASSSMRSVVSSFVSKVKEEIASLSGKFISYDLMLQKSRSLGKDNFSTYNDDDVNCIYSIYMDKTQVIPFDAYYYRPGMYKVSNMTIKESISLERTHNAVMKPIIMYYMSKYDIPASKLEIKSAKTDDDVVGKEILFAIDGISASSVYQDYRRGAFGIDVYSLTTDGTCVKVIIK